MEIRVLFPNLGERRFGVGRGGLLEEVLLFGGITGEEVERTMKMLEEMYGARRKWIELHSSSADATKGWG